MPMLSSHQIQPKTLIHPHEQCLAAYQQWSRVMEYITLHWKASSQLKSLAAKPAADTNLLRLLNATLNRPSSEGDTENTIQNGGKDYLNSGGVCSDGTGQILTPWKNDWKIYQSGIAGLHEEMEDFYNYMSPMPEEKFMRTEIVNRLRQTVISLWPNAEVKVYGSFETGLYLPTSDIDVVIKSPDLEPLTALTLLEQHLTKQTDCDEVKLIRTSVPIVKFTDKTTAMRVDVSINIHSALTSADFIKEMIQNYPELKYLGFVLKQFLASRGLLESFNGGISSYCLILLIVSYLQLNPEDRKLNNLGVQLIKFLELYGRHFNYLNCGIRVTDGGSYFRKGENSMGDKFSLLCVEDPFNPENDVGQSCFGAMKVREEFDRAFRELCDGVLPQYSHLQPPCTSLLGRILHIAPEVVAYRRYISDRFLPSVHAPNTISTYIPHNPIRPPMFLQRQQQQLPQHPNPYSTMPPPQQYTQFVHHLNHPPPTQSQQPLPYNQQQLHLFQHFAPHYSPIHQFMPGDGLQPASIRLPQIPHHYTQPNFHFQPNIMPPLQLQPVENIYPVPITVAAASSTFADDRSDSDSLSSQHSSTRSPSTGQANGNVCNSNTKGSNESEAEQEVATSLSSSTLMKPSNSLGDTCFATASAATSTTTTSTYTCNNLKSIPSTVTTVATTAMTTASNYFSSSASNRSKNNNHSSNERNGLDRSSFRCDSSNGLDTLCEITSSRQSSATHSGNNNSSYTDRQHHQQSNLHGYTDDGSRSHYNYRGNGSKHNNKNHFYSNSLGFGRSSPTQTTTVNRPSNQSRQLNNKGSSNLRNHQVVTTANSCHLTSNEQPFVKSVVTTSSNIISRNRSSNVALPSSSPSSSSSSQQLQETSSSVQQNFNRNGGSSCQSGSLSYGPSNSRGAPKKGNNFSLVSANSYSRQSHSNNYKSAKISSSSSSSSSCSPASMTPAVAR